MCLFLQSSSQRCLADCAEVLHSLSPPPSLCLPDQGYLFCLTSSLLLLSPPGGQACCPEGLSASTPSVANCASDVLLGFCVLGKYTPGMGKEGKWVERVSRVLSRWALCQSGYWPVPNVKFDRRMSKERLEETHLCGCGLCEERFSTFLPRLSKLRQRKNRISFH